MVASSFPSADSFSTSLSIVICDSAPARSGFESLSASCSSFPAVPSETVCSIYPCCSDVSAWNFSRLADASASVAASRFWALADLHLVGYMTRREGATSSASRPTLSDPLRSPDLHPRPIPPARRGCAAVCASSAGHPRPADTAGVFPATDR